MPSAPTFGRRGVQASPAAAYVAPTPSPKAPPASNGFDLGWLLFSLHGRIRRRVYWFAQLGLFVLFQVVTRGSQSISGSLRAAQVAHTVTPALLTAGFVGLLLILALLVLGVWVGFAVVVKRWHDRDKSWPWALLGFVPLVGWLWQGIECGFLDGTLGPNRFGPSPKGVMGVTYGDMLAETFS